MKPFKIIYSLVIVAFILSQAFSAETKVFDGTTGLTNWEYIGAGNGYNAENVQLPLKDLMTLTTPVYSDDYGVDGGTMGWDVCKFSPIGKVIPSSESYVGIRYKAPKGQLIKAVRIPKFYTNTDVKMHIKIVDAEGNIVADSARATSKEMVTNFVANSLNTSMIEIRWVNTHTSTIIFWGPANGVVLNTIEVDLDDDPEYIPYDPITFKNPNRPTKWFGYYSAYVIYDGGPLSATNWGNAFPEVGSYTNLNHVFPSRGQAMIDSAIANHSYMLVDVMWQLFVKSGDNYVLKSDWQNQVNALVSQFAGYEEYIGAISPLDEPYIKGVSQQELELAIAALKDAFPGIPIYVNFAYTQVFGLTSETLPAGVDWIGFDLYESNGEPVTISDIQTYVNHIKSIKSANQKLFLVPPSAMNLQAQYTDQQLADTINAFYSLMQSDSEIIGMMVFPSDGCRQVMFDGIGSTIPIALAAQQAIGQQIAGEVCGDIWNGFYKFDYNRDCKVNFIDWAGFAERWMAD